MGTGKQRPNFEGNRGTKIILGNREHRKQIFDFWGTREQANLLEGNKGTGTPMGGPHRCYQGTIFKTQSRYFDQDAMKVLQRRCY